MKVWTIWNELVFYCSEITKTKLIEMFNCNKEPGGSIPNFFDSRGQNPKFEQKIKKFYLQYRKSRGCSLTGTNFLPVTTFWIGICTRQERKGSHIFQYIPYITNF